LICWLKISNASTLSAKMREKYTRREKMWWGEKEK
jgi:hypothetical protein